MYKTRRNYENVQRALYDGLGEYQIPQTAPIQYDGCDWIGFKHDHVDITGEHTHLGYYHKENGTRKLTNQEKKIVELVKKAWYSRRGK